MYLGNLAGQELQPLLQLPLDSHMLKHGPFSVLEGDRHREDDALWKIKVP